MRVVNPSASGVATEMSALVTSSAPTGPRFGPTGWAAATSARYFTMIPETISSPEAGGVGCADTTGVGEGELDDPGDSVGVAVGVLVASDTGSLALAAPREKGMSIDATSEPTTTRPRHFGAVNRFDVRTTLPLARLRALRVSALWGPT